MWSPDLLRYLRSLQELNGFNTERNVSLCSVGFNKYIKYTYFNIKTDVYIYPMSTRIFKCFNICNILYMLYICLQHAFGIIWRHDFIEVKYNHFLEIKLDTVIYLAPLHHISKKLYIDVPKYLLLSLTHVQRSIYLNNDNMNSFGCDSYWENIRDLQNVKFSF